MESEVLRVKQFGISINLSQWQFISIVGIQLNSVK